MILARAEAPKVVPLIQNLDAYDAYLELLNIVHNKYFQDFLSADKESLPSIQGKLQLIDELKQIRDRLKDTLNGRI